MNVPSRYKKLRSKSCKASWRSAQTYSAKGISSY
jgi:hypothetical protein